MTKKNKIVFGVDTTRPLKKGIRVTSEEGLVSMTNPKFRKKCKHPEIIPFTKYKGELLTEGNRFFSKQDLGSIFREQARLYYKYCLEYTTRSLKNGGVGITDFVPGLLWAATLTKSHKGKVNPNLMVDVSRTKIYKNILQYQKENLKECGKQSTFNHLDIISFQNKGSVTKYPSISVFLNFKIIGRIAKHAGDSYHVIYQDYKGHSGLKNHQTPEKAIQAVITHAGPELQHMFKPSK